MIIGVVKEIKNHEYRVGMTPGCVSAYVHAGHTVLVQSTAGIGSGYSDEEYAQAGAKLIETASEVWEKSEMIVKVKEPIEPEYKYLREDLILYTYLHLAADKALTEQLVNNKVKSVAYETIVGRDGGLPCLMPMSCIAGRLSIQEGAKYLERPFGGRGVLLGGVPGVEKAEVVILGGGVVGTNACQMAVGLGARVTVLDTNISRLLYLDDVFSGRITTLYSSKANIESCIRKADLVIGAVLLPGREAPKLVKKEHLGMMKKGSLIVDVAVDQGGCFETTHATTHQDPIFDIDGVMHYCVANMPGAVPRSSTMALTNTTLNYGLSIANLGLEEALRKDEGLAQGLNTYDGNITFKGVSDAFNMLYTPVGQVI